MSKEGTQNRSVFPSLDFLGRSSLRLQEVAEKLRCSIDHIERLSDDGSFLSISRGQTRRIEIEAYRAFVRARVVAGTITLHAAPLTEPCLEFESDHVLTVQDIGKQLTLSDDCVVDLIDCGDLVAIDIRSAKSTRPTYRIPIESYRVLIADRLASGAREAALRRAKWQ